MTDLSIIIPCYKNHLISACVQSILDNELGPTKAEVVIITLPQVNINLPSLKNKGMEVKLVKSTVNHPSLMRNLGVNHSKGKTLVFLDDDTAIPKNWLKTCHQLLKQNPEHIICGPNLDQKSDLGSFLANLIQSLYISEGLRTHCLARRRRVDHHNIPLNNCALSRKIFEKIGGFNEKVDYYLDDVEFFYIAHKLGWQFIQYPELAIQHHARKFPFEFLKYKFKARKKIGSNMFFFPELYQQSNIIKIVLLSYLMLPVFVYLSLRKPSFFMSLLVLYFLIITLASLKTLIKNWLYAPIILIGIFLTHSVSYLGFTWGILKGVLNWKKHREFNQIKKQRYAVFTRNN